MLLALALLGGTTEASQVRYRVKPNETLFRIAQRTGLSEAQIQRANPSIRGTLLYAGQVIVIPPRPTPPGSVRVRQGETLTKLVRRLGTHEVELRRANPQIDKRGTLNAGQLLRLPPRLIAAQRAAEKKAKQKAAALARQKELARQKQQKQLALQKQQARQKQLAQQRQAAARKPAPRPTTYRVRFGDSFFSIARRFGLSVEQLQRFNPRYSAANLQAGHVLRLTAPAAASTPRASGVVVRRASTQAVWTWPVPGYGRITSDYGWRVLNEKKEMHTGIDVAAPTGTPVVAARSGRVTEAYRDLTYGWGWTVVIQHPDGWKTRYAHLNGISVRAGQLIRQNERLGSVGSTGRVTGPHLHFGLYQSGSTRDPLALYRAQGD